MFAGKSIPIHCVVEQAGRNGCGPRGPSSVAGPIKSPPEGMVAPRAPGLGRHNGSTSSGMDLDTFAIVPGSTLFSEVVRTALLKIGYSTTEALGAKGQ